jgi:hypothetical protein
MARRQRGKLPGAGKRTGLRKSCKQSLENALSLARERGQFTFPELQQLLYDGSRVAPVRADVDCSFCDSHLAQSGGQRLPGQKGAILSRLRPPRGRL